MNETLTMQEIEDRFPSQWVLIGELVTDDQLEILSGRVLGHGPDRESVEDKVDVFRPKRFTVMYTGSMSNGRVHIL